MKTYTKPFLLFLSTILLISIFVQVTNKKLENLRETKFTDSDITTAVREQQLECLARNIYHEAAMEPFEGKVAVAQVTLNRAASSKFPNDICKVVHQRNIVYDKVICQFSWYCETSTKAKPIYAAAYKESYEVAKKVLLEGFRLKGLTDAMYYHASYISPNWNKQQIAKIGNHIFYK
jgi:spore germination cell wall hydrolase CwlJ-like protein